MFALSPAAQAHFRQPHQVGELDPAAPDVATARVGEPVSGAILQLHVRVDDRQNSIVAVGFKAYGCAWTIACGSWLAAWLQDRPLDQAVAFHHSVLAEALAVPPEKLHCAVLAQTALKAVLRDTTKP